MKKEKIVLSYYCDICEKPMNSPIMCQLCGKELCQECSRYICAKAIAQTSFAQGSYNVSFGSLPYYYTEELIICKACTDSFKLALRISAGQEERKIQK